MPLRADTFGEGELGRQLALQRALRRPERSEAVLPRLGTAGLLEVPIVPGLGLAVGSGLGLARAPSRTWASQGGATSVVPLWGPASRPPPGSSRPRPWPCASRRTALHASHARLMFDPPPHGLPTASTAVPVASSPSAPSASAPSPAGGAAPSSLSSARSLAS